ncbi:hypothetical protein C5C00_01655 [Rathayibacter rathayi]|nr:hypothetical protein C5C47_00930 [Rathayibacter rathayi]PPG98753.1 hypothetical protein C5C00_01655 [Rathayibacter rathayi]
MYSSTVRRTAAGVTCVVVVLASITSCSGHPPASGGAITALQERLLACSDDATYNAFDALDGSASSQDAPLLTARWDAVRDNIVQAAVCGGHARVVVVSSSSATSILLLDSDLQPAGATENARLRRVDGLVDETIEHAKAAYAAALPGLEPNGSDLTAAYFALGDYIEERDGAGGEQAYSAQVATDGIQNVGVNLGDPLLTAASAESLATSVAVPQLDGRVSVSFLGIGKVAGSEQPSTEYVNGLKAFWSATCEVTGAGSCTVLTDFGGGSE